MTFWRRMSGVKRPLNSSGLRVHGKLVSMARFGGSVYDDNFHVFFRVLKSMLFNCVPLTILRLDLMSRWGGDHLGSLSPWMTLMFAKAAISKVLSSPGK